MEPKITERPNYIKMGKLLSDMRSEMLPKDTEAPTPQRIAGIKKHAEALAKLALQRAEAS